MAAFIKQVERFELQYGERVAGFAIIAIVAYLLIAQ
jgi:hypothetical protein